MLAFELRSFICFWEGPRKSSRYETRNMLEKKEQGLQYALANSIIFQWFWPENISEGWKKRI